MRCAIYARKSTDDDDKSDELKSVEIQIASAKRFALKQGWTVLDEHIYVDDNVSGVRIHRPALDAMKLALGIGEGARAGRGRGPLPFDVLIVRDQSRLIRNSDHTTRLIKRFIRSGVQLWFYKDGRRIEMKDWEELSIGVQGFVDAAQRLKASQDAREGLTERALKGYNTGGCCFGYRNVPVMGKMASGQEVRLYTDLAVNEGEADVVRRLFRFYADGYGHVIVAKTMNGDPRYANLLKLYFDGVRPAKPIIGKRGSGSWSPSSIWEMLRNERYRGILTFGVSKNEWDEDGEKRRSKQTEGDKIIRTERADLAIVPPDLWKATQERISSIRKKYVRDTKGQLWGRPGVGVESRYLLSGFGACGCCGRNIAMIGGRPHATGGRRPELWYGCAFHKNRGRTICDNGLKARVEEADDLVISRIREIIKPAEISHVIERSLRKLEELRSEPRDDVAQLRAELEKERRMRENYLDMIGEGKAPRSALERVAALDASIEAKEGRLADYDEAKGLDEPIDIQLGRYRRTIAEKIERLDEALRADVPMARQALRRLIQDRIEFAPERRTDGRFYRLSWEMPISPFVFKGEIGLASPRGNVPHESRFPWAYDVAA